MNGRERAMRVCRDATVVLGAAIGAAFVVALVLGIRAASIQGYWAAGYLRIAADGIWQRFDPIALVAAAVAAAGMLVLRLRGARMRGAWLGPALGVVVLVGGVRVAALVDAWHAARGPNVLLVSIDTLRADHLGAYGYALPTSPTIDRRLVTEGVTFERALSQSPKTTPSHMTMLTSLYPCVHGVELWEMNTPGRVLNPGVHTLAEVLKNAGYATAAFTGGTNLHRSRGFDQGFDVYRHSKQLARASEWIRTHRGRKWFVFFHTFDVHDPYTPPDELIARFDGNYRGPVRDTVARIRRGVGGWEQAHDIFWKSVDVNDPATVRFVTRLYDAAIRHMDGTTVTPLLELLDALDIAHDTLVVFTADHGEAFGEHGRFLHDDLYAGTLHVPLILRFPGRLPAGRRVLDRVRILDVMPTILDLLGIPAPASVQGRSLAPLARGDASTGDPDVVSEHNNVRLGRVVESVRRGSLAYIIEDGTDRLFDVVQDPAEVTDVASSRSAEVESMRNLLTRWHVECREGAAKLGATGNVAPDEATTKRLRALGYVE